MAENPIWLRPLLAISNAPVAVLSTDGMEAPSEPTENFWVVSVMAMSQQLKSLTAVGPLREISMRAAMLIGLLAFVTVTLGQNHAPSPPRGDWEHTLWIDGTLTAIDSIEAGMSHKELEKLFEAEGGIHARGEGEVYIYKECPFIKVNVQLTKDGKISRISRPYLERPTRAKD